MMNLPSQTVGYNKQFFKTCRKYAKQCYKTAKKQKNQEPELALRNLDEALLYLNYVKDSPISSPKNLFANTKHLRYTILNEKHSNYAVLKHK